MCSWSDCAQAGDPANTARMASIAILSIFVWIVSIHNHLKFPRCLRNRLATKLNVSADYLMGLADDPTPPRKRPRGRTTTVLR